MRNVNNPSPALTSFGHPLPQGEREERVAVPAEIEKLPVPRWVYTPGETAEPDDETLARAKSLVPPRFESFVPFDHPALIYGLALNDAGFFWESHEVLEAVWKAAPMGGRDRILLRACIQIANAGLKQRLGRAHAVERLLGEARIELAELSVRAASPPLPRSFSERLSHSSVAMVLSKGGDAGLPISLLGLLALESI